MSATLIDGNYLAKQIKRDIANEVRKLKEKGITPCLAACLVGDDPASHIYVSRKAKACEEMGIRSLCQHLPTSVNLKEVIDTWNDDKDVHGILVQLPLPDHMDRYEIINSIKPEKDVDGFHPINLGRIVHNRPHFLPCTPLAVRHILQNVDGKRIAIINRSIIVGQPLALMLTHDNATVTICHERTINIKDITLNSDIIVTAVGKRPNFSLKADMVRKGQTVIDVGISRIDGKIAGDADEGVADVVDFLTPPVGGVGVLTVTFLLQNTITAAKGLYV